MKTVAVTDHELALMIKSLGDSIKALKKPVNDELLKIRSDYQILQDKLIYTLTLDE